jgi:hypothetical protein
MKPLSSLALRSFINTAVSTAVHVQMTIRVIVKVETIWFDSRSYKAFMTFHHFHE